MTRLAPIVLEFDRHTKKAEPTFPFCPVRLGLLVIQSGCQLHLAVFRVMYTNTHQGERLFPYSDIT